MYSEKIIMRDSPEAASPRTVTGWVSSTGHFFTDERSARYAGCTHVPCERCGAPTHRAWLTCKACREKAEIERYRAMPRAEWDGVSMLYSQTREEYFADMDAVYDVLADEEFTIEDLRLVICVPNHAKPLDGDQFCDDLPDDGDGELPAWLEDAVNAFNEAIKSQPPLSWSPGKIALAVKE